jgi:NTE family protein
MEKNKRKTVGLVLGSGGGRGLAHIGVIRTLLKHNIPIDYISGSSIGAVVGAYYALNLEVENLEKIFKSIMKKPFWLLGLNWKTKSFINTKNIYEIMKYNFYGEKTFEDTKIPLRINTTDIDSGNGYVFSEGKIIDAVIPSMTIPGILPVVEKGKMHLVDGGLSNAIPADLLKEFKPDVMIVVDLYNTKIKPLDNYGIKSIFDRVYKIYISKLSEFSKKNFEGEYIILNPDTNEKFENLTFQNIERNIKIGEQETEEKIEEIKKLCF